MRWPYEQTVEKLIGGLLIYSSSNACNEDICRVHANIGFGGEIFAEAMAGKQLLDELSVSYWRESKALHVPMP